MDDERVHAEDCDLDEDCSCGALEGEVVEEPPPAEGTLAWLALQPTVTIQGLELPACHRFDPERHTLYLGDDDGRCRVTTDGERCKAPRTRRYGLCMPHAGGGARDLRAIGAQGGAALARLRLQRRTLGIS